MHLKGITEEEILTEAINWKTSESIWYLLIQDLAEERTNNMENKKLIGVQYDEIVKLRKYIQDIKERMCAK